MITVEGKNGIKATMLADSVSPEGVRLMTMEIEYPRLILAEFNTHRDKSRNSFSSRAVPFEKMIQQLTGRPVRFGANQAGMQDKGEDFNAEITVPSWDEAMDGGYFQPGLFVESSTTLSPEDAWEEAKDQAIVMAKAFKDAGYHKQVYNRLLEPFQMMKTIVSGTEWSNFFWLRDDLAADPTLAELARCMREVKEASKPDLLQPGEWHLPYVDYFRRHTGEEGDDAWGPQEWFLRAEEPKTKFGLGIATPLTLEQAIKVSCARCAAVSYRNEGYGVEKSVELYERLVGSDKKHASALEHCATPMERRPGLPPPNAWEHGVSHMDKKGNLWSGNFRGWIQHRKLIKGENYEEESA